MRFPNHQFIVSDGNRGSGNGGVYDPSENSVLAQYFGKASKSMVSKITFKHSSYPDDVYTYTYPKDNKGNITSIVARITSGNNSAYTIESKVTYQCQ